MGSLIKKFGAFSIGPIGAALIGFITVPIVTYIISPEEYGRASMFTLAQGLVSMFMYLGMDQAFVREFNSHKDSRTNLFINAAIIPMVIAVLTSVIIICVRSWVSEALFGSPDEMLAVMFLALELPFLVLEQFSLLTIRMEEKGVKYSIFVILQKLTVLFCTVLLLLIFEKSFRSVVIALALGEMINGIILTFVSIRSLDLKEEIRFDNSLVKTMLFYGLPLIPANMLSWLLSSMDRIMLRTMCGYTDLGLYAAAYKIVSVLAIVQSCFTLFWTPVAFRWFEEKVDINNFEKVGKVISMLMTVMLIGILIVKNIVLIILGKEYAEAVYIFPFLLLYPIMYTMSEATMVGIAFSKKTYYNIVISAISGAVNIGLNYALIPSLGGKGAAVATGMSYVVFFAIRTGISRKLWEKFKLKDYIQYSVIILINCIVHAFITGWLPYVVSVASLLAICIIEKETIKEIIRKVRKYVKDRGESDE